MLFIIPIIGALVAGCYLLALASDGFAYELSRVVEWALDFVEYELALRQSRRAARTSPPRAGALRGIVQI